MPGSHSRLNVAAMIANSPEARALSGVSALTIPRPPRPFGRVAALPVMPPLWRHWLRFIGRGAW
jgi:hypothetical protein